MTDYPTFVISLEHLGFYSRIGVDSQELEVGNEFSVDCEVIVSAEDFVSEELESTISYAEIYFLIEETMKKRWKLLESVAKEIADKSFGKWDNILGITVKITKITPPIPGIQGSCSIEYRKRR